MQHVFFALITLSFFTYCNCMLPNDLEVCKKALEDINFQRRVATLQPINESICTVSSVPIGQTLKKLIEDVIRIDGMLVTDKYTATTGYHHLIAGILGSHPKPSLNLHEDYLNNEPFRGKILAYIHHMQTTSPNHVIKIDRRKAKNRGSYDWALKFPEISVDASTMGDLNVVADPRRIQCVFTKPELGELFLKTNSDQEQMYMMDHLDLTPLSWFRSPLEDDEVVIVSGHKNSAGHSLRALFMDATDYSNSLDTQYTSAAFDRELHKAFLGFTAFEKEAVIIETGGWGCQTLGGQVNLKVLIQLLAASTSYSKVSKITFHFAEAETRTEIENMLVLVRKSNPKVLYGALKASLHLWSANVTTGLQAFYKGLESCLLVNSQLENLRSSLSKYYESKLEFFKKATIPKEINSLNYFKYNFVSLPMIESDLEDLIMKYSVAWRDAGGIFCSEHSKAVANIIRAQGLIPRLIKSHTKYESKIMSVFSLDISKPEEAVKILCTLPKQYIGFRTVDKLLDKKKFRQNKDLMHKLLTNKTYGRYAFFRYIFSMKNDERLCSVLVPVFNKHVRYFMPLAPALALAGQPGYPRDEYVKLMKRAQNAKLHLGGKYSATVEGGQRFFASFLFDNYMPMFGKFTDKVEGDIKRVYFVDSFNKYATAVFKDMYSAGSQPAAVKKLLNYYSQLTESANIYSDPQVLNTVSTKLMALKIGESRAITVESPGHATLAVFERTSCRLCEIKIFNTGYGLDVAGNQDIFRGLDLYTPFTVYKDMDMKKMAAKLIPRLGSIKDLVLQRPIPKQPIMSTDELIRGQRGGTCAVRRLWALAKHVLGFELYQEFKVRMFLRFLETLHKNFEQVIQEWDSNILEFVWKGIISTPHFEGVLLKGIERLKKRGEIVMYEKLRKMVLTSVKNRYEYATDEEALKSIFWLQHLGKK